MDICRVNLEHNNKCKICSLLVVSGNGQALSGMPDIELLNILTISCNTKGTEKEGKDVNCSTNIVPVMQEMSSAMQKQGQKGAVQEQTAKCIAMQTQSVILI